MAAVMSARFVRLDPAANEMADEHQLRGSSLLGTPTMRTGDMAMNDAGRLLRAKTGRDALLAAAASIFFEQGYEATRLDDILERRSEEHTSELQTIMRTSYAVFCLN